MLRTIFTKIASQIEQKVDELKFSLKLKFGSSKPLHIVTYRSYGKTNRVYVKGRVLENKNIVRSGKDHTVFQNVLNMYKRFETDEVRDVELKLVLDQKEYFAKTDEEGYFQITIKGTNIIDLKDMWHKIPVEIIKAPYGFTHGITAEAEVLIPPSDAEYGIISDIDDTIVKTSATNLLSMSRNTFLHNAHTRLPFAGVSEFYKALLLGRNGKRNNPFFYVSSSPWNLYDLLRDFMDINDIPAGPLLLRDFGIQNDGTVPKGHMGHKFKEITQILETYPQLNFILIGDSGQEDPVIYKEVVKNFPGRILAIYIRDVQHAEKEKKAMVIAHDLKIHNVDMIVVDDTVEASQHAAANGFIFKESIPVIKEDKKLDKGEKPGKEEL
ncbi:MAG: App1 family protein [Cytophagaceae bacterium]